MSIFSVSSTSQTRTPSAPRGNLAIRGILASVCLFGAAGCTAELRTRPVYATYSEPAVYAEADSMEYVAAAPVNIESYPSTNYGGTTVYYVDGRWYAPSARGWGYYRAEPRALAPYRVDFERRYPRTYVGGTYTRATPRTYTAPRTAPVERRYEPSRPVERRRD